MQRVQHAEGQLLSQLANASGTSTGELRFAFGVLAGVPLGFLHAQLPGGTNAKHAFSCVTGTLLVAWLFGSDALHLLTTVVVAYIVMAVNRRHSHEIVWLLSFAFLLYLHAANASGLAWAEGKIDFTGTQMMLTVRVITLAVNWADGLKPASRCSQYMLEHRLTDSRLPGLLEFAGYCMHPYQLIAGPWCEFLSYRQWANSFSSTSDRHAQPPWSQMPSSLQPTLGTLAVALGVAAFYVLTSPYLHHDLLISDSFLQKPFVNRLAWLWLYMAHYRSRFYFIWKAAEAANVASGISFKGYSNQPGMHERAKALVPSGSSAIRREQTTDSMNNGNIASSQMQRNEQHANSTASATSYDAQSDTSKGNGSSTVQQSQPKLWPDWTRCRNVDVRRVELATSGRDLPQYWNINTGLWLRHYVYERLLQHRYSEFTALLVTQTLSGVWHGLYAGYWMFFVGSVAMLQAAKNMYKLQRMMPRRWQQRLLQGLHMLLTVHHLSFLACCFAMVEFKKSYKALRALNFSGVFTTAFMLLPLPALARKLGILPKDKEKGKAAHAHMRHWSSLAPLQRSTSNSSGSGSDSDGGGLPSPTIPSPVPDPSAVEATKNE